ncbi:MAG TPA: Crp/Fnr family transcriptional regulator [Dongiaceae bacterium]|nr:Crp/Fnr family transcriptional regulator [Dongiaceae bacterium]
MTSNVEFSRRRHQAAQFPGASESNRGDAEFCIGNPGSRQIRSLKTGESLFLQGDMVRWVWVLREGWAFRYQTLEDGRRQIVDFLLPGDILGIGRSSQMPYGVEALSPCAWVTQSREAFLARLAQEPALGLKLVDMLSAGQVRAFEQMTSVGRRTARERVAHLLLDLAKRAQTAAGKERLEVTMPLMLSHIGDALGLATETVCRCLAELKRAGILVFSAGRLEILDLEGLSDLVGLIVEDDEDRVRQDRRLVA